MFKIIKKSILLNVIFDHVIKCIESAYNFVHREQTFLKMQIFFHKEDLSYIGGTVIQVIKCVYPRMLDNNSYKKNDYYLNKSTTHHDKFSHPHPE